MGRPSWCVCLLFAVLPFSFPALSHPQKAADDQGPVFRLQVRRVPIDVVVLDKNGNPVHGLKKSDFVVKEDGKAQHVLSFDAFDGTKPAYTPPKLPPLPPNTF